MLLWRHQSNSLGEKLFIYFFCAFLPLRLVVFFRYGIQKELVPEPKEGKKICTFVFEWIQVFKDRFRLLRFDDVKEIVPNARELQNYERMNTDQAEALVAAIDAKASKESSDKKEEEAVDPEKVMQHVERYGDILFACFTGKKRYGLECWESEAPMFVVYQSPLSEVLSLKALKDEVSVRNVLHALEIGKFCSRLTEGNAACLESLFLEKGSKAIAYEDGVWEDLRACRKSMLGTKLLRNMGKKLSGRDFLKSEKLEYSKLESANEKAVEKWKKRVATVSRLAVQILDLVEKKELPVDFASRKEVSEILEQKEAAKCQEMLEAQVNRALGFVKLECVKEQEMDEGERNKLAKWLISERLFDEALPPRLDWKSDTKYAKECPYPLMMLGKRSGGLVDENSIQIVGIFAGNVREWLGSPVKKGVVGERGWDSLCIRGKGYSLYEMVCLFWSSFFFCLFD